MKRLNFNYLGRKSYSETWELQKSLLEMISSGTSPETVLLVEHSPVITLGRTGDIDNLLFSEECLKAKGVDFFRIERGGDITYHGLGQLVGYPILNLKRLELSLPDYLRKLEQAIMDLLVEYNIQSFREPNYTGVWCDNGKLCAIGIAARKYITYHGFALNINTDLTEFKLINPCGITNKPVTSMKAVLNREVSMEEVIEKIQPILTNHFG